MISKEDYLNYLQEMDQVELRMVELYKECAEKVRTPDIKTAFSLLTESEKEHVGLVEKLKALLLS